MTKNKKRGVTLLEMTIVMALISVMTLYVIAFSGYCKNYSAYLTTNESVKTDLDSIKYIFDIWSSSVDDENTTIYFNGSNTVIASVDGTRYSLNFGYLEDELSYYCTHPTINENDPNRVVSYKNIKNVKGISYSFDENTTNGNYIIKLTVYYTHYDSHNKTKVVEDSCIFFKCIRCASIVEEF